MRNTSRGIVYIVLLSMVFFFAACDKKRVEQVGEVTPPPQQEKEVGTPSAPGEMAMPGPGAAQAGEGGAALRGAAAAFEENDIHFDYDRFTIRPEDRKILAEKASFLNANPSVKVRIEGHADERGTTEYNLALGERRANAAKEYLVFLGISADRIATVSYGEERPLDPAATEEAYAMNRRAHFVILQ
ncbi:MAG TPA: peptidoglycan-associated lipoprotein Pal [Deltaproteobacteria bacterium]|nr:peptidoglycan-associated lipoprotein Pal [Deltaproteobacteria bacterium]HOI07210.1 peptidoglycan-associated lipoprotein Pal [Deltaproteobacteria bacterium]